MHPASPALTPPPVHPPLLAGPAPELDAHSWLAPPLRSQAPPLTLWPRLLPPGPTLVPRSTSRPPTPLTRGPAPYPVSLTFQFLRALGPLLHDLLELCAHCPLQLRQQRVFFGLECAQP